MLMLLLPPSYTPHTGNKPDQGFKLYHAELNYLEKLHISAPSALNERWRPSSHFPPMPIVFDSVVSLTVSDDWGLLQANIAEGDRVFVALRLTSGAIQKGVPTEVFLLRRVFVSWAETPAGKNPNFRRFSFILTHWSLFRMISLMCVFIPPPSPTDRQDGDDL